MNRLLVVLTLIASPLRAAELWVSVDGQTGFPEHATVLVEIRQLVSGTAAHAASRTVAVTPRSVHKVEVPEGLYDLRVLRDGYWSAGQTAYAGATPARVTMDVYRSVPVRGRLVLPKGVAEPPEAVTARFRFVDASTGSIVMSESGCTLDGRDFHCEVPLGRLDISIKATGYVAHHWWDLEATRERHLGALALRQGAAFVGQVLVPGNRSISIRDVVVRLEPRGGAGDSSSGAAEKRKALRLATRPSALGLFHFDGIPPGDYFVSAVLPGLTSRRENVRIVENLEASLREPLLLEKPYSVDLAITPPSDPSNQRWVVDFLRETETSHSFIVEHHLEAPLDGHLTVSGLFPGEYTVELRSASGDRFASREVSIPEHGPSLSLVVGITKVRGTVSLGEKRIQATLWFGGEHGDPSVRVASNADGEFSVSLPRFSGDRVSEISIKADDPRIHSSVSDVDLVNGGDGTKKIDIRLSDSILIGQVVGEDGMPVKNALVSVTPARGPTVEIPVGPDGSFDVYGIPPGTAQITAVADLHRRSDSVTIDISTDPESVEPVQIVVKSSRVVKGRVTSSSGPIAGAVMYIFPAVGRGFSAPRLGTGVDGRFEQRLPPGTPAADIFVGAPGFATRFFRQAMSEEPIEILLSQQGGTILVEVERSVDDVAAGLWPTVVHAGCTREVFMLFGLTGKLEHQSGDWWLMRFEDMEPGEYTFCYGPRSARCQSSILPPFGTLRVRLPR